jgi:hypothetical protein
VNQLALWPETNYSVELFENDLNYLLITVVAVDAADDYDDNCD